MLLIQPSNVSREYPIELSHLGTLFILDAEKQGRFFLSTFTDFLTLCCGKLPLLIAYLHVASVLLTLFQRGWMFPYSHMAEETSRPNFKAIVLGRCGTAWYRKGVWRYLLNGLLESYPKRRTSTISDERINTFRGASPNSPDRTPLHHGMKKAII